jgi:hypothetical protein
MGRFASVESNTHSGLAEVVIEMVLKVRAACPHDRNNASEQGNNASEQEIKTRCQNAVETS